KTLTSLIILVVNCSIFEVNPELFEKNPKCQEINETLYKYVDIILSRINETADPLERNKRSTNDGKFYNFTVQHGEDEYFHLYTKVPETVEFPYETEFSPFPFFMPFYAIEVTEFEEFPMKFVLVEGKRCRWKCDKITKMCEILKCWEKPSICIGDLEVCSEFDGDGVCTITSESDEIKKSFKENEYSSIDLGNKFNVGHSHLIITNTSFYHRTPTVRIFWDCSLKSELEVFCYISKMSGGPSIGCLKTLAG
uniref:Uncharacterized protein n=1 Tax=Megaselia scalaris TaxID=36166 RepID=T1GEP5_MEGSC